jgi:cyclophilin family peptidyl-prolyl cis-trans isomerase
MTIRRLLPLFCLAALAGCSTSKESAAPRPPEEVAEATPPDMTGRDPKGPDRYTVLLDTTKGPVTIEVDRSLSPHGADRFYRLVKEGFYGDAKFFRVVPGFVVQFGMAADPKVNAKWQDANIPDDPVKGTNARGTVTFAKAGPNTRTSQIFINLGDNSRLDADGFPPFGKVTGDGMNVVEQFNSEYDERPDQGAIAARGNEYLDKEFPNLDGIKSARVVSEDGKPVGDERPADQAKPAEEPKPAAGGDAAQPESEGEKKADGDAAGAGDAEKK